MADGDYAYGTLPPNLIQPPVDLGVADPSSLGLNINPASGSPDFLPAAPNYPYFQSSDGSTAAAVSAPQPFESEPALTKIPTPTAAPAAVSPDANAAATTASTGGGNWLSTTAGNIGNWISNNPMQAFGAVAGGGLLLNQLFGSSSDAEAQTMKQLGNQAGSAQSMATMLSAPLTSGILPPGAQNAVDLANQQGRAQAISSYAKMGMANSTGQADALQANNERTQAMKFGIANQLFTQAAGYAKMASTDYADLLKYQMEQDQDFSNALSKFVSALAGGRSSSSTSTSGA